MARIERTDLSLSARLDELEQKMFVLKINYEKYFSGIDRVEPMRDRDEIKRIIRDLLDLNIKNNTQKFKFQGLKARFQTYELYWTRNIVQMERGVHPKMRFKAGQKQPVATEAAAAAAEAEALSAEQEKVLRDRQMHLEREEKAFRLVYDKYMEARGKCGQSVDVGFDTVRDALRKQVRTIKSTYSVDSVKFRIVVEDGKAKVKAVPQGTQ